MSDFEPTLSQQQVIDARNKNVLVSAAAGSGKTAVLTERIVGRLLDPVNPVSIDRLLIVTFTEAAASEMRERIGKAIGKRLDLNPGNEFLRKQYTLVNSALIMTIHGFCLYLIRNHFDRIGIDPSFRVQSTEEGKILLEDSLDEAVLMMQKDDPAAYEKLREIRDCEIDDEKIKEIVRKINTVAESQPFPGQWYEDMKNLTHQNGDAPENSILFRDSLAFETDVLTECFRDINDAIADIESATDDENENELQRIKTVFESDRAYVAQLLALNSISKRCEVHRGYCFPGMPGGRMAHVDPDFRKSLGGRRGSWKDRICPIREKMYANSYDTILSDEKKSSEVLLHFLTLSENLLHCYAENKRKKNVIDFSDMEHFALEILMEKDGETYVPSETALAYQNYFEEVMVDEYQDSNAIQETLLNAVANIGEDSGNRFMVGDVKQSIYRFRLACPEIFRRKYDEYKSVSDEEDIRTVTERDIRIDLSQNFRSRPEVLESVNKVFEDAMIREVGEIEYDVRARLNPGASYPENEEGVNKSELIVLRDTDWGDSQMKRGMTREAHACGKRILELVENHFQVADKNDAGEPVMRDVRFSDMIILLWKTAKRANVIKGILESMGIPTVVLSKEGYFSAAEVSLMLNIISVIDNPLQDIPLLGVLHSFVGGFTEPELARIRCGRKKVLLYDALLQYEEDGENEELKDKISAFLEKLSRYRALSGRLSIYELLIHVTAEEGIFDHFRVMKAGEVRIANIKMLLNKAKEYSSTGYSGIFTFVQYIENMKKKEIDFGEANLLDENANVVRIFTMHKSKGLEFPVCFLLGMGEDLTKSADKNAVVIETGVGIGMDYTDLTRRVRRPTFSKNMILYRSRVEQRGEDLRLLYVAMTRAKEKLIMIGCATNTLLDGAVTEGPNRKFTYHEIMGFSTFLHFLYSEAMRNPDLFDLRFFGSEEAEGTEAGVVADREALRSELESIPASASLSFFEYPYGFAESISKKVTVSELKRASGKEEPDEAEDLYPPEKEKRIDRDPCIPHFMREEEPVNAGITYGLAFHALMEILDFSELYDVMEKYHSEELGREEYLQEVSEIINGQIERLSKTAELSREESELIHSDDAVQFMTEEYAYRMMKADRAGKLYREQPFVYSIPASRLDASFPEEEKVLIQGVIDVYFEEDGELVLLDYKTDHASTDTIMKRYHAQLEYYTEALEKLEDKKVKEAVLYSVRNSCCVLYEGKD